MKFKPTPYKFHVWEDYASELQTEYRQCLEEGLDVEPYKDVFDAVSKLPKGEVKEEFASVIADLVHNLPTVEGYKYNEPSDLESIRALRNLSLKPVSTPSVPLEKKIEGAWYGRICGCLLGKPVEGAWTPAIVGVCKCSDNYPLSRYLRKSELDDEALKAVDGLWIKNRDSLIDVIGDSVPPDDDTNYTVMAQAMLSEFGFDFTPENVLYVWIKYQGKNAYCTAERVAYKNYVGGYMPPYTAIVRNPYREWIGAQIRGDYYGYVTDKPEVAAKMAWSDASISHIKNGIYGEMFISAMLSTAHKCEDVLGVIYGGLSEIPATSRLYEQVMELIEDYKNGATKDDAFKKINERYSYKNSHDWCHTISNALIVVASLLYGGGDYGKSICMAVEAGFDTDCNGATIGSVIGMMYGIDAIGKEWTEPTHGVLRTQIFGRERVEISALVEKTLGQIKRFN
ncbi:MAG: ADP-ribosylglycohydrolase family protein [Clostridia bacterium]|nr:ADP-ribosylglycohydrolase family protein [Clostridia bacterium]